MGKKCSIIIPVLESYEAVRRQILYMNDLGIPENFEVIFIDDGSQPPIFGQNMVPINAPNFQFKYGYRADFRPFTKACAMNEGVKMADGEWVWLFAIDYIVSKEMIDFLQNITDDMLIMPTLKYAILDEEGKLEVVGKKKLFSHCGVSAVKKEKYQAIGGFDEKIVGFYPPPDDVDFGDRYFEKYTKNNFCFGPTIYAFPKDKTDCFPNALKDDFVDLSDMRPDIFYYSDDYKRWKFSEAQTFKDEM